MNPITPKELAKKVGCHIPKDIIKAFNNYLEENSELDDNVVTCRIELDAIVKYITKCTNFSSNDLYDKNYLDVEPVFRRAGWEVTFHKSPYYDTSPSFYVFSAVVG